MRLKFRTRLAVLAATVGVAAAAPAAADASALGYQYWGATPFSAKGVVIPKGQLTHAINGKGLRVNWDAANFLSAGNLCDSSIRFTYGYGKLEYRSSISHGCTRAHQWKYYYKNWNAPRGTACAELWVYGWRKYLTKQCHFVS